MSLELTHEQGSFTLCTTAALSSCCCCSVHRWLATSTQHLCLDISYSLPGQLIIALTTITNDHIITTTVHHLTLVKYCIINKQTLQITVYCSNHLIITFISLKTKVWISGSSSRILHSLWLRLTIICVL